MSDLFGGFGSLISPIGTGLVDDFYHEFLVVGGPGYAELAAGNKALLRQELEKHIGAIDPELLRLILEWNPTSRSMLAFLTSVGSYPSKRKIEALKKALTAPDRYSNENFMRITRILVGDKRRRLRNMGEYQLTVIIGPENPRYWDDWDNAEDPDDPDALAVTRRDLGVERKRRQIWEKAWNDYLADLKRRTMLLFQFRFLCDLPTHPFALVKISPYLRLPSGEYLAPGQLSPSPVTGGGTDTPSPVEPITPVGEDKKDEKKFPWWIVIAIGVAALLIMKD